MTSPASPHEAVAALLECVAPVGFEALALEMSGGRVLAGAVHSDRPSPALDVSAMDGYAVAAEVLTPGRLPVSGTAQAGRPPLTLAGGAVRIFTGAPVPAGADLVLKREDVTEETDAIFISEQVVASARRWMNIRRRGENAPQGAVIADPGREVTPAIAAALAASGCTRPVVYRRVRMAVLVTGDEVLSVSDAVEPWQLRDSNCPAMRAMFGSKAWVELQPTSRAPDDPELLRRAISDLLGTADILLLTGGVSMGDRDFVPGVLKGLGARMVFHRVPQRPGRPVLGAVSADGKPILGLPGNPLSVLVTARRLAVPVAARLAGFAADPAPPRLAHIDGGGAERLDLWWHRLVRLTAPDRASVVLGKGSGDIPSAARSDGFAEFPPGQAGPGPWPVYAWTH